jgi:hypothetical protein
MNSGSTYVRSSNGSRNGDTTNNVGSNIDRNDTINDNDNNISNEDNVTVNNNDTTGVKKTKIEAIKDVFIQIKTKLHSNINNSRQAMDNKMKSMTKVVLQYMIIFQNNIYKSIDFTIIKLSQLYPYLRTIYKLLVLSQKILYLYGHSTHIHPVLSVLGISLIKNQPEKDEKSGTLNSENLQMKPKIQENITIKDMNINNPNKISSFLSSEWKSILIVTALISIRTVEFLLRSQTSQGLGSNSIFSSFSNFFPLHLRIQIRLLILILYRLYLSL